VRSALPEAESVAVLDGHDCHARTSRAIKTYREMFADYVAGGASRVHVVGEFSAAALQQTWWWWARYESAVNRVYAEFPVRALCLYDTRTGPEHVLEDVASTHPQVSAARGRHVANERYVPLEEFVPARHAGGDPLETAEPVVELVDPSPATARHVVLDAAGAGRLPAAVNVDSVVMVVSEAVTNAAEHGIRPVGVRLWASTGRVLLAVRDQGAGPADPLAGLVPAAHYPKGGVGLWLSHELCEHVTLEWGESGYTYRAFFGDLGAA
jgi:anti-sigma regulatory factor (Ser/Thr protein kinase)